MPTIYAARCDSCHADGPQTTAGYQAYVRGENELVPLPHPGEGTALHAQRSTFDLAGITGRYVRVQRLVCTDCAEVTDVARLGYPISPLGYFAGWIGFIAIGARMPSFHSSEGSWSMLVSGGLLVGLCLAALIGALMTPVIRLIYRVRARRIHGSKKCTKCKSPQLCSMESTLERAFRCPHCGELRWRYRMCAVS
jgi:hypothetical protein